METKSSTGEREWRPNPAQGEGEWRPNPAQGRENGDHLQHRERENGDHLQHRERENETISSTGRGRMETKAAKTSTRPTTRYEAALCNCMCENVQIIVSKGFSLSDPTQSNENRKI